MYMSYKTAFHILCQPNIDIFWWQYYSIEVSQPGLLYDCNHALLPCLQSVWWELDLLLAVPRIAGCLMAQAAEALRSPSRCWLRAPYRYTDREPQPPPLSVSTRFCYILLAPFLFDWWCGLGSSISAGCQYCEHTGKHGDTCDMSL